MQADSCLREGECLIRVSVIIIGYVRFRLKLNFEVILESKAILLQKICSGVVSVEICKEVGLLFVHFIQYSDWFCNPGGRKIRNLGQFYQFFKAANTSTASTNIPLTRRTKPAQHGENQNPSVSIHGQQSHPRSKVPCRLLTANQEGLSPFLFWRKLKNLKALFSPFLTSKEVKENAFANKTNELGPV